MSKESLQRAAHPLLISTIWCIIDVLMASNCQSSDMSQFNLFSNHVNGNLKFLPRLHFTKNIHANCKTVTTVFFLTDEGKMVEVESDLKKKCKIFGDGRRWRGDWPLFIGPLTSPGAHQQAPNRQKQKHFCQKYTTMKTNCHITNHLESKYKFCDKSFSIYLHIFRFKHAYWLNINYWYNRKFL